MIDPQQLGYLLFACLVLIVVPLLATRRALIRRLAGDRLDRLGAWARVQLIPEPEPDPLALDMYRARQREKLYADIARLRRILATDEEMSATRQLGNRIAYDWLLNEFERTRHVVGSVYLYDVVDDWSTAVAASPVAATPAMVPGPRSRSTVEVLDIGWR